MYLFRPSYQYKSAVYWRDNWSFFLMFILFLFIYFILMFMCQAFIFYFIYFLISMFIYASGLSCGLRRSLLHHVGSFAAGQGLSCGSQAPERTAQ